MQHQRGERAQEPVPRPGGIAGDPDTDATVGHVFEGFFGPRETRTYLEIERRLAGVTTRIVALSGEQREELLAYGVGRPEQVVVVPLGLDLGPYLDVSALRGRLRGRITPLMGVYIIAAIS